jgi:cytidylate kinase
MRSQAKNPALGLRCSEAESTVGTIVYITDRRLKTPCSRGVAEVFCLAPARLQEIFHPRDRIEPSEGGEGAMTVITISRQFGAGGVTLGREVAQRLGISFFDNELIQMVAEQAKVTTTTVEHIEREAGGKLLKFISSLVSKSLIERVLDDKRGYIDEKIYVDLLHRIIEKIASAGDAVILGRGSQYILRDHPGTVHVLLVAEKHTRFAFMEEHYEMTPPQAVRIVGLEDKRRANLYSKFGREDYDQPALYHLVLNMTRMPIDRACDMVCALAQGGKPH